VLRDDRAGGSPGARFTVVAGTLFVVATMVVIASPWLMRWFVGGSSTWIDAANIGQAYGGAAAVLSAFALVGVVISIALQSRAIRLQRTALAKERHFDLVKILIDHPTLRTFAIPVQDAEAALIWRVCTLLMSYWATLWDVRDLDETRLRQVAKELFTDGNALDWWAWCLARGGWSSGHQRERVRFEAIITEEFDRVRRERDLFALKLAPAPEEPA